MDIKIPFSEYPLRVYRCNQCSVRSHDFVHRFVHHYKKNHRRRINALLLTTTQKQFFIDLLEISGVIGIEVHVNSITVHKWPGFEWQDIEPTIIERIAACPIDDTDLASELDLIRTNISLTKR